MMALIISNISNLMTTTAKLGMALVVVLVLIMVGWIWYYGQNSKNQNLETAKIDEIVQPTPTPKLPNTFGTGMSKEDDASVEALETDLNAVSKQMTDLGADTAGIDYGITNINK